jgi:hypothetical protein
MEAEPRTSLGVAVGAMGSIFAAAGLVAVRDHFALVNVALILVLLVLLGAVIGGRVAGVTSAFVAAISLEFFHTRPFNSLKISDAADIETTLLFLVVGLAIGEIAVRADRIRASVAGSRGEIKRFQRIARLAANGESIEDLISALRAELMENLKLRECTFERPPFTQTYPTLEPSGHIRGGDNRLYTKEGFDLPRDGVVLPVIANGDVIGRFVLTPTPGAGVSNERRLVAAALADQLSVVLRRHAA